MCVERLLSADDLLGPTPPMNGGAVRDLKRKREKAKKKHNKVKTKKNIYCPKNRDEKDLAARNLHCWKESFDASKQSRIVYM